MSDDNSLEICNICFEPYNVGPSAEDPTDRRPVLTPNCCGNTLCMQCAEFHRATRVAELSGNRKKIPCPFCNELFHPENERFVVNKFAMGYLHFEKMGTGNAATCGICLEPYEASRPSNPSEAADRRPVLTPNCCGQTVCNDCAGQDRATKIGDLDGKRKRIRCIYCNELYHSENVRCVVNLYALRCLETKATSEIMMLGAGESVTVSGAGLCEINGIYEKTKDDYDGAPIYQKVGHEQWQTYRICLYSTYRIDLPAYGRSTNTFKRLWRISYVRKGTRPGTQKDVIKYATTSNGDVNLPPETGWGCRTKGISPPPEVRRHCR